MLQRELVRKIALKFLPMYDASKGKCGYVSIQGDPYREDLDSIVKHARFNREAGANIMVKIPATVDGIKAIGICLAEGMPVNATEVMCIRQTLEVCEIYRTATKGMKNPPVMYLSHIAGIFDEYLAKQVKGAGIAVSPDYLYQAGFIMAQRVREFMDAGDYGVGLINGGARGLNHFTDWVGGNVSNTINWKGMADSLIELNPPVVNRFSNPVPASVLESLLDKVPEFRKAWFINGIESEEYEHYGPVVLFRTSFEKAWSQALATVAEQRSKTSGKSPANVK